MKTMNRTYIRWTAFFLMLILSLSAIAVVPAAAEENTPTQGTLVISEICAAPSDDNYEFVEIVAKDADVTLSDYSICRYGFSHGGEYAASGLCQLMGEAANLAKLDIVKLPNATIKKDEIAILWFVSSGSSLTEADFRSTWSLDASAKVIKVTHNAPATAVNTSAGSNFLPNIKAGFALSLIRTQLIPETVTLRETITNKSVTPNTKTTTLSSHPTTASVPAERTENNFKYTYGIESYDTTTLQALSDCVALYYTNATKNTNSHHYDGFVDLNNYRAAISQKTFYAMDDEANKKATVIQPAENVLSVYDANGYIDMKVYWNGTYSGANDANETGYTFVADGRMAAATPGTLSDTQYAEPILAVPAAQNKVSGNTQDVRFIGWVDSTDYREVGIKVTAEYVSGAEKVSKNGVQTLTTETVYSTVTGNGKTYTTSSPEINKGDKGHLMAIAITGIDTDVDTHIIFYVTAFGVLADGTTVYGKTASAVLNGTKLTNPAKFDFRIMTFNVLRANQRTTLNYDAALKSVLDYDADVVGFQEYCAAFTANLTKKLNDNGYTVIGNPYDTQRNDYSGNTLYADQNMTPLAYKTNKFICLDSGAGCVSGTYNGVTNTYPGHWITWAVLQSKVTGEVFAVANTHGFHKSNTAAMIEGQCTYHVPAMIQTIYNLMNNVKAKEAKGSDFVCPVLFVGDYNMVPTSEPYLKLFRDYNTQYAATYGVLADARFVALQGYASGRAYHTLGIADRTYGDDTMFDHIVVTESVGVIDHKICVTETTTKASDHYPVYVDIVLSQP